MLRAIIRCKRKDPCNGLETEHLKVIDFDSEAIEEVLSSGGYSEDGYEHYDVLGVEIVPKENKK